MSEPITSFSGQYRFLSNFWPANVELDDYVYPSVEHAYVAAKTLDKDDRDMVRVLETPGMAKRFGRRIVLRSDWDEVRVPIMRHLIDQKFNDPKLKELLLATGKVDLIEGNTWGDTFWGVCKGVGENYLGQILMAKRHALRLGV